MKRNPELARNLWLELTPHRLVAVPGIVAALTVLGALVLDDGYGRMLGLWAAVGCAALLGFWGGRLAAGSIADEAANRTWDGQRLSALTPWEMTWGKLAGSTAIAWFAGLLCLAVYVSATAGSLPSRRLATNAASLVAGALLCQGVSLLAALIELRRGRAFSSRSRGAGGMILAFLLYWSMSTSLLFPVNPSNAAVTWFGATVPVGEFLLASIAFYAAWAITGCWRLMREELQVQAPPYAWLGFSGCFMAYVAGFWEGGARSPASVLGVVGTGRVAGSLLVAFLSGIALLYCAALFESKDPVVLRRLVSRWRAGGAAAALEVLPCWLASVPLVALVGATAAAFSLVTESGPAALHGRTALFVVSCLGFAARDLALLLAFNLGSNTRRADAAALFYWVLLYGVVPTIVRQLDIRDTLYFFYPTAGGGAAVLAPAAQAAVVLVLLRSRWRRKVDGLAKSPGCPSTNSGRTV